MDTALLAEYSPLAETCHYSTTERLKSLTEFHANVLTGAVEALRAGSRGLAQEAPLFLGRPWGFRPEDIRTPVWLWYGDADSIVPVQMGHYLAQAIRQSQLTIYPGEGHMLHINHWNDILHTLVAEV